MNHSKSWVPVKIACGSTNSAAPSGGIKPEDGWSVDDKEACTEFDCIMCSKYPPNNPSFVNLQSPLEVF